MSARRPPRPPAALLSITALVVALWPGAAPAGAAELLPFEKVEVYNITNGNRWETYVMPMDKGSGEICINGAAARLCLPNDLIIIAIFR